MKVLNFKDITNYEMYLKKAGDYNNQNKLNMTNRQVK